MLSVSPDRVLEYLVEYASPAQTHSHVVSKLFCWAISVTYALFVGDSDFSSEYDSHEPQRRAPASPGASLTEGEESLPPAEQACSAFRINADEETSSSAST